ncbi:DUF6517 family protein [Halalkalicoccus subterraneus]|uniref:DUF6517 family protein n=1 Tax=Halalkalicoccus subterraneus TaxID=2675002 RepID=UPI000EFA3879|nr:DUF6517 family protein [Halalkalicoccus subterraneus]
MAQTRRRLCSLAALALVGSSGCLGGFGEDPDRFVAPETAVSNAALGETGYELDGTEVIEETRTVEAAGQSRDVEAVNRLSEYHRAIDIAPLGEARAAVFATLCTPAASMFGRTFNPIAEMDNRELANRAQSQYEELSIGEEVDRRTVRMFDEEVTLSKFEGEATFSSTGIDVFVHTALAEGEEAFVVVFGVYPRLLPDEEEAIVTLSEGVRIEGEG